MFQLTLIFSTIFTYLLKIKSPPKSPDLNPIEMLWNPLKNVIRKKFCRTIDEVVEAVYEFQTNLTPKKCQAFINKLNEVN